MVKNHKYNTNVGVYTHTKIIKINDSKNIFVISKHLNSLYKMLLLKTHSAVSFFTLVVFIRVIFYQLPTGSHTRLIRFQRKRDVSIITVLLLFICIIITFIMVFTFERVFAYRNLGTARPAWCFMCKRDKCIR